MVANNYRRADLTRAISLDNLKGGTTLVAAARWNPAAATPFYLLPKGFSMFFLEMLLVCCLLGMATFPTSKVHRVSRRKLGKGQHVQLPLVTCVVTNSTTTVTLTFNTPVVINGSLDLHFTGLTLVSQEQTASNVWTLTYSATTHLIAYTGIPAGSPIVQSMQGGGFAGIPAGAGS